MKKLTERMDPFVAMVLGYITLGTPVSLTQVGGSVLIICGVVLATLQGHKTILDETTNNREKLTRDWQLWVQIECWTW